MKRAEITPEMIAKMDSADQAKYGTLIAQYGPGTLSKPTNDKSPKLERAEQATFAKWLNLHGYQSRVWHRLDRETGCSPGCPDFIVPCNRGRTVWIEFKLEGAKLSPAQQGFSEDLILRGHQFLIVNTALEAIRFMESYDV